MILAGRYMYEGEKEKKRKEKKEKKKKRLLPVLHIQTNKQTNKQKTHQNVCTYILGLTGFLAFFCFPVSRVTYVIHMQYTDRKPPFEKDGRPDHLEWTKMDIYLQ